MLFRSRLLADSGYSGIALTLDHVHLDPFASDASIVAARLRRLLDASGLECVVETGGRFLLDPFRKHHPTLLSRDPGRRIDLLLRAVDLACELEAPVVSTWSGTLPDGLEPEVGWSRLVPAVERVLAHADRCGVTIGFEPEPGMLVERLADFERLAGLLGSPRRLGLTLDLGHCVCVEPEPVGACIRRGASALVHVHVEDMLSGRHEHLMFGEGELDVDAALVALQDVGYDGLVAVELSRHAHEAHMTVPRAIEYLRAHEQREAVA